MKRTVIKLTALALAASDALIALRSSVFDFTVYFRLPRNRAAL